MGRPAKKKSKRYILLHCMKNARYEKLRKEKKLAHDVAGLLSDIVDNIAIQQTPSTAHSHSEHDYTSHSVGSPSDCSTYRSVATQTYFEEIFELPKLRPREAKINGRRIIDFQYFFNELKDVSSHSKSLCNLNNMVITKEEKSGICTSYNLKCLVCNFEKKICSESPYRDTNLNADFVSGILSIECDFMDAYILLAQIRLPLLNNDEFIQECKNVCLTMDKITSRILLETYQDASSSLEEKLQTESLARKLVALKRRFCAQENIQREHQLTTTTQECSSVSDNSNIQRESQLTTMKQGSSAHENIQKKFQLTTLKQNSSAHKNIQREPQLTTTTQECSSVSDNSNIQRESQLTAMKQGSSAHENIQKKFQLTTLKQNSSAHKNIQREPQLATMKQSSSVHKNMQREHQLTTTQQCSSVSDNSNIQRESQLTTMKQGSSAHENIQKKFQLTTLKQNSSAHKNIQREPQLATMKQSSSAHKNMQTEHQLTTTTTQQSSSVSDNSNIQRESQLTAMKQSSSTHENTQRKLQLTTLKQNFSAHKHIQIKLAIKKQNSSAHENIQREHQLTTTTQQSSSVSDNSNIQRESILTAIKQSSSTHENTQRKLHLITLKRDFSAHKHMQGKPQLATMKQSSSARENLQRKLHLITLKRDFSAHKHMQGKPQLATMKQSSSARENLQREHKLITTQQCSSTSDNSNLFEQVHSDGLLIEDEFEVKEENVAEEENEFETMMTDQTTKTSNSKLIAGREQVILNTMTVKQEIDSDDENSNKSITKERTNKKSVMVFVNAEQIGAMLTQANEGGACENTMIVNEEKIHSQKNASNSKLIAGREQVILNTITVTKQEIDSDDENFNKPITKETTKEKSVFVFVNAEQIGTMLTQANEGRDCENTIVVNEEKIHLQKNVMVDKNMLVKPEFHDMEMTNKERVTDFDNKPDSESPFKKARTVTYKECNNYRDTQGTPTTVSNKEINVFQNRFESNRLATSATKSMRNGTATSSITNVRNATATISVTKAGGENVTFSIPVKFNENGALILSQNPHDKASGTYQGVNGTASMPGISSAMQQLASIPNANGT